MESIHFHGLLIGIATFLIIGLFHPIVIKSEYYWGTRCWWVFLLLGIAGIVAALFIADILVSALCGVFVFTGDSVCTAPCLIPCPVPCRGLTRRKAPP